MKYRWAASNPIFYSFLTLNSPLLPFLTKQQVEVLGTIVGGVSAVGLCWMLKVISMKFFLPKFNHQC